jgi:hypothetical protein
MAADDAYFLVGFFKKKEEEDSWSQSTVVLV